MKIFPTTKMKKNIFKYERERASLELRNVSKKERSIHTLLYNCTASHQQCLKNEGKANVYMNRRVIYCPFVFEELSSKPSFR